MKNKLTRLVLLAMISAVFFSCTKEMNEIEIQDLSSKNELGIPDFESSSKLDLKFELVRTKSAEKGYLNIALNKEVVLVSDEQESFLKENINDGNDETFWASTGKCDFDFIVVDLGNISEFSGIRILWRDLLTMSPYQIYLSDDYENWVHTDEINIPDTEQKFVFPGTIFKTRYIGIVCLKEAGKLSAVKEFEVLRSNNIVQFPDPKLEQKIRIEINKLKGDIYEEDLLGLTKLNFFSEGITNLTGLEYCKNLETLSLKYNSINDHSPIKGLTNLVSLSLGHTDIYNVEFLRELTNLQNLELHFNHINDISPLAGLTKLVELDLSKNRIKDISLLENFKKLQKINLANNLIDNSDIIVLSKLNNLTYLDLDDCNIVNISCLEGLTELTTLSIGDCNLESFESLRNYVNLESLNLSYNKATDLSPIHGLTKLKDLDIRSLDQTNIEFLKEFKLLEFLSVTNNQITDISPLAELNNLQTVYTEYNGMIIKEDEGQGTKNLNVVNKLLDKGCYILWKDGNITD